MKTISKKILVESNLIERTERERDALMRANHPFLVSARWAFQTSTKLFFIMDYVPYRHGRSVFDHANLNEHPTIQTTVSELGSHKEWVYDNNSVRPHRRVSITLLD
jgi:serine/threonine protein kinase